MDSKTASSDRGVRSILPAVLHLRSSAMERGRLWRKLLSGAAALQAVAKGTAFDRIDWKRRYNDDLMGSWLQDICRTFRRIADGVPAIKQYSESSIHWHQPLVQPNGQLQMNCMKGKHLYQVSSAVEHSYVFEVLSHYDEWIDRFGGLHIGKIPSELALNRMRLCVGRTVGSNVRFDGDHWCFDFSQYIESLIRFVDVASKEKWLPFELDDVYGEIYNDS